MGDRFLILNRGQSMGDYAKEEISQAELTQLMAGGAELEALQHELQQAINHGESELAEIIDDVAEDLQFIEKLDDE